MSDRGTELEFSCREIGVRNFDGTNNWADSLNKIVTQDNLVHLATYKVKTRPRNAVKLVGYNKSRNVLETIVVDKGNIVIPNLFNRQKYGL